MSNPRPTARELAHEMIDMCFLTECHEWQIWAALPAGTHTRHCDYLAAAISADRAASDALEDRMRAALEKAGSLPCFNDGGGDCIARALKPSNTCLTRASPEVTVKEPRP